MDLNRWFAENIIGNRNGERWHNYLIELCLLSMAVVVWAFLMFLGAPSIVLFGYLILVIALLVFGFTNVPEPERWVIECFGQPFALWAPGPHLFIPLNFIFRVKSRIPYKQIFVYKLFFDANETAYSDFVNGEKVIWKFSGIHLRDDTALPSFAIFIQVLSPVRATYRIANLLKALISRVEGAARITLSPLKLQDTLTVRGDAIKLMLSNFLRDKSVWDRVSSLEVYDEKGDPLSSGKHRFVQAALIERVPFDSEPVSDEDARYDILEWGIAFVHEGIALLDFKPSQQAKDARSEMFKKQIEVQMAEFERKIAELQGMGEQDRLAKLKDFGLSESEAAAYATAIRMMDNKTLRDKTLLLAPGADGLDFRRLAAIFGVVLKKGVEETK